MSIAPLPSVPSLPIGQASVTPAGAGPNSATGSTTGSATGFAALVAGLLAGATAPRPVAPTPPPPPTEGSAEQESDESPDQTDETTVAVVAAGAAVALPSVIAVLADVPRPVLATGPPAGPVTATLPVATEEQGTPDLAPTSAVPTPAAPTTAVPADPAAAAPSASAPVPTAATTTATGTPTGTEPAAAPVAGPTPATPTSPTTTPTGETRPVPVTSQVVPEVVRLASRGDGLHRITMKLQPEALGEVRVTLTLRDGEVHVRLAAGDEARRALIEGTPELRRVLEAAGASDPRVVVRDLSPTAGNPGPTSSSAAPAPGGGGVRDDAFTPGQGGGGSHDQHAGTRGGSIARDGLTDGAPVPRPEPARRSPRGIDLTM